MYRLLEVGEVIEKGDEYWWSNRWNPIVPSCFGCKVKLIDSPIRRLVKPAVTPAASSVPDPGEGWRLLEPDETIQKDDRYFDSDSWVVPAESVGKTVREAMATWPGVIQAVRRREGKPAPVVSVGDRVKVLSGPWAGCTGVVLSLDAYVLLSDYGKMTAKYDSTPVIELEHVRVGGDKLILSKVTVEKLPPVVPEVLYRDLAIGEVIRQGDEIRLRTRNDWEPAGLSEGSKIGSNSSDGSVFLFRRPIRLQSPGWRYLDAGETVQAGDEAWSGFFNRYVPASADRGSVAQCEKLFRRKLPANQGG